jgi:hypothetical protein
LDSDSTECAACKSLGYDGVRISLTSSILYKGTVKLAFIELYLVFMVLAGLRSKSSRGLIGAEGCSFARRPRQAVSFAKPSNTDATKAKKAQVGNPGHLR